MRTTRDILFDRLCDLKYDYKSVSETIAQYKVERKVLHDEIMICDELLECFRG